ncbi:MAG: hypothetical protein A2X46_04375 [Lentisphaerae bacterium GWF2_57_35]|nr:MAG: hypothetical protein A2X46_04375 [Lentisphaerae bacterium GWF2_57_35]
MKKFIAGMMVLAGVASLTASAQNLTLDFPVTVSVASDAIDLQGVQLPTSFGIIGFNTTNLSNNAGGQPRATVNNVGYAAVDYTASAAVLGTWTLGTAPAQNTAVLYGIFTQAVTPADNAETGRSVAESDFGPEDRLSGVALRATASALAQDSETAAETKGNNVYTTQSFRSLRYRLDAPTDGATDEQTIVVTIGAVAI